MDIEILPLLVGVDSKVHPITALEHVEAAGAEGATSAPVFHLVVDVPHAPVVCEDPLPVLLVHGGVEPVDLRLARTTSGLLQGIDRGGRGMRE